MHIYCGNGKGKTTAALGLAMRAAGRGKKVVVARFLKTDDSGEVKILQSIPEIHLMPCEKSFGFTFQMSPKEREEAGKYYTEKFLQAAELAQSADLLILDEIIGTCNEGLVEKQLVDQFLQDKPDNLEVVLTGRNPWEELFNRGDYITSMEEVRHPYHYGLAAREGIEY